MTEPERKTAKKDLDVDGEDNVKMDLREIGWVYVRIHLAQDMDQWWTIVNMVINL
jgi:hypothetical protein